MENHPSILIIAPEHENTPQFSFNFFFERTRSRKNRNVGFLKKLSCDIPVKIIKENSDIFAEVICKYFNESLQKSKYAHGARR